MSVNAEIQSWKLKVSFLNLWFSVGMRARIWESIPLIKAINYAKDIAFICTSTVFVQSFNSLPMNFLFEKACISIVLINTKRCIYHRTCHHLFLIPSLSKRISTRRTASSSRACLKYARKASDNNRVVTTRKVNQENCIPASALFVGAAKRPPSGHPESPGIENCFTESARSSRAASTQSMTKQSVTNGFVTCGFIFKFFTFNKELHRMECQVYQSSIGRALNIKISK